MDKSKTKAVIGEGAHFSGTISNARSIEMLIAQLLCAINIFN